MPYTDAKLPFGGITPHARQAKVLNFSLITKAKARYNGRDATVLTTPSAPLTTPCFTRKRRHG